MNRALGQEHRLGAAVAASLAVHAAAMTLPPPAPRLAPFEAPVPLQVRLLEPPPLAALIERRAPAPQKPAPVERAPRKQELVPITRPDSLPPPATTDTVEAPTETPEPVPEPVVPAAPPPRAPVAAYAPTPRAPTAELLSGYGKTISQALGRYKEYPRIAQMRGWEGSVMMRLRVAPSGRLIDAELHTSSGHDVLDKQALAMATKPERLPAPPDGLRDDEVVVLVPVVFRLER